MNLWLIRADVSLTSLHRWIGTRGYRDIDNAMHHLLTESFGADDSPRPYRLIAPPRAVRGTLYGYVSVPLGELLSLQALYADPIQTAILSPEGFDEKLMPDDLWAEGRRMGIEVRVRPVRRSRLESHPDRPRREWDAYLHYLGACPGSDVSREHVYAGWMAEKVANAGALIDGSVRMVSYRQSRMYRQARGPDAVMRGDLTITDGNKFKELVERGLGRHRAYGYGMILPRPPTRAAPVAPHTR